MKNKFLKIIAFVVIISTVCCFFASAVEAETFGVIAEIEGTVNLPVTGTDEPVTGTDEPVTGTDEPVTGTDEPVTGTDEPVTGTDDPVTGTDDPVTGTDDPATETDEPEEDDVFVKIFRYIVDTIKWIIDFIVTTFC